jgi:hypothetical protein
VPGWERALLWTVRQIMLGMTGVGQPPPTSAVGRVSLYKCRERMEEEQVDRSTLVILAIEAFETLRVNNRW